MLKNIVTVSPLVVLQIMLKLLFPRMYVFLFCLGFVLVGEKFLEVELLGQRIFVFKF